MQLPNLDKEELENKLADMTLHREHYSIQDIAEVKANIAWLYDLEFFIAHQIELYKERQNLPYVE